LPIRKDLGFTKSAASKSQRPPTKSGREIYDYRKGKTGVARRLAREVLQKTEGQRGEKQFRVSSTAPLGFERICYQAEGAGKKLFRPWSGGNAVRSGNAPRAGTDFIAPMFSETAKGGKTGR